ncbi:MAG: PfkB family carbohydrate kinase [Hyphomicrobium sp.]
MAKVLAMSSMVAKGTIGLQAAIPALHAAGHDVLAYPTIILSSHPGPRPWVKADVSPETLTEMLDAHDANGWLSDVAVVLTGYLPTPNHVRVAADAVTRVRARSKTAIFICDPVLGDDPTGLYIPEASAAALRDRLVPLADIATPNRFELGWLTGRPVHSAPDVVTAARALAIPTIAATSIPDAHDSGALATVFVDAAAGDDYTVESSVRREAIPHGSGDLFAGLLAAGCAAGLSRVSAFKRAMATLHPIIAASAGRDDLDLTSLRRA